MLRAEMNPKASDEEIEAHGRAADRFALGCIYLELLSRLVLQELPLKAHGESKPMFSNNIEGLCAWAAEMKQQAFCPASLHPLFDIATAMIRPSPDMRPGIDEVIDEVMKAGEEFACESCRREHPTNKSTPSSPTTSAPLASQQMQSSSVRRLSRISSGTTHSERKIMPIMRSKTAAPTMINGNQGDHV